MSVEQLPGRTGNSTRETSTVPFPIKPKQQKDHEDDSTPLLPSLPPQMESIRSHRPDEIVRLMKRTPLFMTSLEDAGDDDVENIELEAIRALQYEGTQAEIALGFKESGNEAVKTKRWKDGRDYYTQALRALREESQTKPIDHASESGQELNQNPDGEAEIEKEKKIEEACYVNRALCNLSLQNYRSTILDCASALRLNRLNVKAYYRSSLALNALSKFPEALDACNRGLGLSPSNAYFTTLLSDINSRSVARAALEKERALKESRLVKQKQTLAAALLARGITIRDSPHPPSLEDAVIHLAPDPLSPSSTLIFPLLLLYPLHAQSDFVKAFSEADTLAQHLAYIFPLPWDVEKEYRIGNVELYAETGKGAGGLIKVGRNVPLLEWVGCGKVVVVDGVVKVNVLIKGRANGWIQELKRKMGQ